MLGSWLFALLFFSVCTVLLTSGIYTLQGKYEASLNRAYFALTISITIWSAGMAFSTIAPNELICEIWRRLSAVGWGTTYAILLHFVLILSSNADLLKKHLKYFLLYLPALLSLFAFSIPNGLNPSPYQLEQIRFGWVNVAQHNYWDLLFYAYYISYVLMSLLLLLRWGKKSTDKNIKKQSHIISLSIVSALIIGTLTDVVFSSFFSQFPQMAPVIMLIPLLSIYNTLQKDGFGISKPIYENSNYIRIFLGILVYIAFSAFQIQFSKENLKIASLVLDGSTIKGVVLQIQMLISLYLVLKLSRPGYIVAVLINVINLVSAVVHIVMSASSIALPGIFSYVAVLIIITLIKVYKDNNSTFIEQINAQLEKEKFYSTVFRQAPVGISIVHDKIHTRSEGFEDININPMYEKILGRDKSELRNTTWTEITHPDDLPKDLEQFERFKNGIIDGYSMEKRYIKPDGSAVWVDMLIAPFISGSEKSDDHVCIIADINKRKLAEESLKYNNEHVVLTGLYNRDVLEKLLGQDALTPSNTKRALVGIDLSSMHLLSLRYGFHYSQNMLKKCADAIKVLCSENYILYHTYENRFVFYIKDYSDTKELTKFCKDISKALNSYLYVHGIGGKIGVVEISNSDESNSDELLKKLISTTETMVKETHNDFGISFYGPETDLLLNRENDISRELEDIAIGIKPERLYLQFQPIIDAVTNRVFGFEALARLKSEKYGPIPPSEFIPIAEKTNVILSLGDQIIRKSLFFLSRLKKNNHDSVSVSINISTIQLLKDGFVKNLLATINELQIAPENVGIELTESVFAADRKEINDILVVLKNFGIKILIDDFGTGYSSLARVRDLHFDCLKIDKSFIDKLLLLSTADTITSDIISMAHKLGYCVIAEGVEYFKQLDYLRSHSCDRIQGYLISRPLDEETALAFLKNNLGCEKQYNVKAINPASE